LREREKEKKKEKNPSKVHDGKKIAREIQPLFFFLFFLPFTA